MPAVPAPVYVAGLPPKGAAAMSLVIVAASAWPGMWNTADLGYEPECKSFELRVLSSELKLKTKNSKLNPDWRPPDERP